MKKILLWIIAASAVCAQQAISPPVVGAFRDSTGSLQRVIGVPGNFVLAGGGISNVRSAAFSASAGLAKTDAEVLVLNASAKIINRFEVPAGPALFAFDAKGAPALAFFSNKLFQFAGSNLNPTGWTGDAISIASTGPQSATVIVHVGRELQTLQISLPSGDVNSQTRLFDIAAPALLFPTGNLVFTSDGAIVVRDPSGVERQVSTAIRVASFESMAGEWVTVHEAFSSRVFALRIGPQDLDLYQLPEVTP
jgi:hypothetical protein